MTGNQLFFKDKIINGSDLELIFHKDYQWEYNTETYPIIKYKLTNCKNLSEIQFDDIDYYNDGVYLELENEDDFSLLVITNLYDGKCKIVCEKITFEESEYRKEDYIDIIKAIKENLDYTSESQTESNLKLQKAIQYVSHELDIANRKASAATWLSEDKKNVLKSKIEALQSLHEILSKM